MQQVFAIRVGLTGVAPAQDISDPDELERTQEVQEILHRDGLAALNLRFTLVASEPWLLGEITKLVCAIRGEGSCRTQSWERHR